MKLSICSIILFSLLMSFHSLNAQNNAQLAPMGEILRGRAVMSKEQRARQIPGMTNSISTSARMGSIGNGTKGWWNDTPPVQSLTNCPPDTVEYLDIKAWVREGLPTGIYDSAYAINVGTGSAVSIGQWYPAPQALTVSGFRFIAYLPQSAGNFIHSVTCNIYNAGTDSLPLGAPVQTILVNVDTSVAWRYASFITSVNVAAGNGYVITIENNAQPTYVYCGDNQATPFPTGFNEWLACAKFTSNTNPWQHSWQYNVNGQPANADYFLQPILTYSITANFTSSVNCFGSTTVNFTNTSSPIYFSRFYNFHAFLVFLNAMFPPPPQWADSTFVWTYGDASPNDTLVSPTHTYPGANPYSGTMTGRLQRWRGAQFCTDSKPIQIGPQPSATIAANGPVAFCIGNSVLLSTGSANSYQWYRNGNPIPGATTSSHNAILGGVYTVKLSNSSICTDSTVAGVTVTLLPGATASISSGGPLSFCNGGSVTLTASGGTTQQWYLNGNLIPGATNANFNAVSAGSYTVKVFNSSGCPDSTIVPTFVDVQSAGLLNPGPSAVCSGPLVMNALNGVRYQWFQDNNLLPGETNQQYTALVNGSYAVEIEFASGCIDTMNPPFVLVIGAMNANVNASGPLTFCGGGSVVLSPVTQGAGTYQWYDNNVLIPNATTESYTANTSGLFTVVVSSPGPGCTDSTAIGVNVTVNPTPVAAYTVSGPTTICPGGSVTFTASGGLSYQWVKDQVPIPGAVGTTYTVNGTDPGQYNVIVANGPCSDTLDNPVLVISQPLVASTIQSGVYTICSNNPLLIEAMPSGAQNYRWFRNGVQVASGPNNTYSANVSGDYTVKVSNPGCSDSTTVAVLLNVNPAPNAPVVASGPLTLCSGDSVDLSITGGVSYQWFRNGTQIPGATTTQITVGNSGLYSVRVINGIGCADSSASANVVVSPSPSASLSVTGNLNFCVGNNVLLTAPGTIQGGFTYVWLRNGNVINGATAPFYSASNSGTYTVVISFGICTDTLMNGAVVTVDSLPPLAGFTPTILGSMVNFNNTSIRANSYLWKMGDGTEYTSTNVTHQYSQGGIYSVVLYAYNACGWDSFRIQVTTAIDPALDDLQSLEIFPNPGNGVFNIRMNSTNISPMEYSVTDLSGKVIYAGKEDMILGLNQKMLDISRCSAGVYLLNIRKGDAAMHRKLIVE